MILNIDLERQQKLKISMVPTLLYEKDFKFLKTLNRMTIDYEKDSSDFKEITINLSSVEVDFLIRQTNKIF